MKRPIFLLILLLLCGATALAAKQHALTLARNNQPTATIVLAEQPTRAAQLGAFELQSHIKDMTGATLPIVRDDAKVNGVRILVGASAATKALRLPATPFAKQEYMVRFMPNTLVLLGKDKADYGTVRYDPARWHECWNTFPDFWDEQATLHAVYDFLEKYCGVRWFDPTETGTMIPQRKTLTVTGSELRRSPFMPTRNATMWWGGNEVYDNWLCLWSQNTQEYQEYEAQAFSALHEQYPDAGRYQLAKRAKMTLHMLRMRTGGEKAFVNHSVLNVYDRFYKDYPGHPIFKEHRPELFAKGYEGIPPQLCFTNTELIKLIRDDAQYYFDHGGYPGPDAGGGVSPGYHWGENTFAVEPLDNGTYCKCDDCMKFPHEDTEHTGVFSTGGDSDYFFNFVNEVAKGVKVGPEKHIATLAYMSHAWPPKTVKLDPKVAVHFCFSANRQVYNVRDYNNELAALKAWREQDPDRPLYLWLYNLSPLESGNGGKFHAFPGFFAHKVAEQFQLFKKYNIRGIFFCGFGQQLEAYLSYKMMDDPTLNLNRVLDEYFTGLYGKAAKPMRQLYEGIEATYSNPKNYPDDIASGKRGSHQTAQLAWEYLGTAERMAKFQKLMDEAKKLAKADTEKKNVDLFEKGIWNYMTKGREKHVKRMETPIPSVRAPKVAEANGDVTQVDWTKAATLGDNWFDRGTMVRSKRKLSGRIAHDSRYVYLELSDPCNTARLITSPAIFPCDTWELFIAGQRALPYRHIGFGPSGMIYVGSNGEVNWRIGVTVEDHGITVRSDKQPNEWVSRLAIPLKSVSANGIAPNGTFYMNIIRVTSQGIDGGDGWGIDTWVSYCTVHEVDRLAEITLE